MARLWSAFRRCARGARRVGRGVGLGAALVLALLADARWSEALTARITHAMWNAKAASQVLVWARSADETIGLSQFVAFVVAIGFVFVVTGTYALVRVLLDRVKALREANACLDVGLAILAVRLATHVSRFAGRLALGTLAIAAVSLAVHCGRGRPVVREAGPVARAGIVIGSEAAALGWGLWFLFSPDGMGLLLLLPILVIFAFAGVRIGSASRDAGRAARDAIAGSPLLVLPFVGLLRMPSPWWCVGVVASALAVRVALGSDWLCDLLGRRLARIPDLLVTSLAPLSAVSIFYLPLRFRELSSISNYNHEAQHLGWLNSATFGKFLFADCSYIYGPVREYLLLAIAWSFGGLNAEHIRVAHLVLTILGTGVILAVGWRVARGRPWVFALWGFLLLTKTPLFYFLDYFHNLNFGWTDGARASFALLALVGVLAAAERFDGSKRAHRVIFGWGTLAGASVLYSHDTGVVAVVAVILALVADAVLRPRELALRARAVRLVRVGAAFMAGTAAIVGVFVLVYVVAGRGPGLLEAVGFVKSLSAGVATAGKYPLSPEDFTSPNTLFAVLPPNRFEFVLPPAILALGAVTLVASAAFARWSARSTLLFALFAFSCALYRYSLMRSDEWHVIAGALGAYLLLVALVADSSLFRLHVDFSGRLRAIPAGAVLMACLAIYGIALGERDGGHSGLDQRLRRVAAGEEHPSIGEPYKYPAYPGIHRTGDEHIETSVLNMAQYVLDHTTPNESIWCVTHFLDGGEIYFLSERRDATHFDIWSEVITHREAAIVLADLRRDPPTLIIGHGWHDYEDAITEYVKAHWKHVAQVNGVDIQRYDPTTGR